MLARGLELPFLQLLDTGSLGRRAAATAPLPLRRPRAWSAGGPGSFHLPDPWSLQGFPFRPSRNPFPSPSSFSAGPTGALPDPSLSVAPPYHGLRFLRWLPDAVGRDSNQRATTHRGHPTARAPTLSGWGNSPRLRISYRVLRETPISWSTCGSLRIRMSPRASRVSSCSIMHLRAADCPRGPRALVGSCGFSLLPTG